jgi:hypothetical protein
MQKAMKWDKNKWLVGIWMAILLAGLVLRYAANNYSLAHPMAQIILSRIFLIVFIGWALIQYLWGAGLFTRKESPYTLAVLRMAVFALPAWFALQPYHQLSDTLLRQWIDLPLSDRVALPFMEYYSLHVPVSRAIITYIQPVFLIVSITTFLGFFTRASAIIYTLLAFYLYSICQLYGKPVNNHYLFWFPLVLACSNCGQVLSVDALISRIFKGKWPNDEADINYTPAVNASLLLLGIIYFFPGFWKVWTCGLDWALRYNLRNILYTKWLELNGWLPAFRIDESDFLIAAVSLLTIVFELIFVFWALRRKHNWLLLAGGVLFHCGILYFTQINFTFLLPLYVCLFNWEWLAKWFKNKEPAPAAAEYSKRVLTRVSSLVLIILVGGNVLVGITKVVSWPLACFPAFDYMVPDKAAVIYLEGFKAGISVNRNAEIGKVLNNQFSSYNVAARENRIIQLYSQSDTAGALGAAKALLLPIADSLAADSIAVYKVYRELRPEADLSKSKKEWLFFIKTDGGN